MIDCRTALQTIGNKTLLEHHRKLAFFCSKRCPGEIILKIQDWANGLDGKTLLPMSGFHTPVEQEVLRILLRSRHPLIIFPARSIGAMRIPADWKSALDTGTLCIASNFPASVRRATVTTAEGRNRRVASLSDEILIPYAAPGGKTEELLREFPSKIIDYNVYVK